MMGSFKEFLEKISMYYRGKKTTGVFTQTILHNIMIVGTENLLTEEISTYEKLFNGNSQLSKANARKILANLDMTRFLDFLEAEIESTDLISRMKISFGFDENTNDNILYNEITNSLVTLIEEAATRATTRKRSGGSIDSGNANKTDENSAYKESSQSVIHNDMDLEEPMTSIIAKNIATAQIFKKIMHDPINEDNFQAIARLHTRITPFVGAGLSCDLGFPLWRNFINNAYVRYMGGETPPENMMVAASILQGAIGRKTFLDVVEGKYGDRVVNHWADAKKRFRGTAMELLPELYRGIVITSNFDRVLENVYSAPPVSYPGDPAKLIVDILHNNRGIFKLYGCVSDLKNIALTKEEYIANCGDESDITKSLRSIFSKNILLFLGCSLDDERALNEWLKMIDDGQEGEDTCHYAIIYDPIGKRRKELLKKNIKAIIYKDYEGFDNPHIAVRAILEALFENINGHEYGTKPTPPPNNLDNYTEHFHGREGKLDEIADKFVNGSNVTVKQTLNGLGGVGKTQLALKYAHDHMRKYSNGICWLNAENEDALLNSCLEFCIVVGLVKESTTMIENPEQFRMIFLNWLLDNHNWLLIFDNADDEMMVRMYTPITINGHIIVTTRRQDWYLGEAVDIGVFPPEEAISFLLRRTKRANKPETHKGVDELAERLGYLPLALEQAGAYLYVSTESFKEYLKTLDEEGLEPFRVEIGKPSFYKNIITTTWQISFKAINNQAAEQFFYICAYMDSVKIPLDVFVEFKRELPEPLSETLSMRTKKAGMITELRKYSLIERDAINSDFISIHRLVQEVVREKLAYVKNQLYLHYCLVLLVNAIPFEYGERKLHELFLKVSSHCAMATEYLLRVNNDDIDKQKEAFEFFRLIGNGYLETARYGQAQIAYKRSLIIAEKVLEEKHEDFASIISRIALAYDYGGNYDEALKWYKKTLHILKKADDIKHFSMITVRSNIAYIYSKNGEYKKALKEHLELLDLFEDMNESKNIDITHVMSGIADAYFGMGNFDEAEKWYKKTLVIREDKLGINHIDTSSTYNNLAQVFYKKAKFTEALVLYAKALDICENTLDKNHHYIATANNNIALVHYSLGKHSLALEHYHKALNICENILGEEHPSTLSTYNNIALVHDELGHYDESIAWHKKTLILSERVLGSRHPSTITSHCNIAGIFHKQGKYDESMKLYEKVLELREEILGEKHPDTIITCNNLALVYEACGSYDRAMYLYRRSIENKIVTLGEEHPSTASAYNNMAGMYERREDFAEALDYYHKAISIYKNSSGVNNEKIASTYNNIALVLAKQNQFDEALTLYEQSLEIFCETLDEEHPTIAIAYNNMASVFVKQENYTKAFDFYQKALAIRRKRLGNKHPDTANSCVHLADVYFLARYYIEALNLYFEGYRIFCDIFGTRHQLTVKVEELMKHAYEESELTGTFYDWMNAKPVEYSICE